MAQFKKGKVLVTGASGFIGSGIAGHFCEQGFSVRAQYRRAQPPEYLTKLEKRGVELVRADLTEPEQIESILTGISGVVHAAAIAFDWGPKKLFDDINYTASVHLLDRAKAQGIHRFLFISSLAVHGFGAHKNSTEEGPYYSYDSEYQRSKKKAEDYVINSNSGEMQTVVIRPGNVYGPGDTTTFYPLFDAVEAGKVPLVGGGKYLTCPIHISDLMNAVYSAYISDISGQIFNITAGEDITWKDVFSLSAETLGVSPPNRNIPEWLALFASWVVERIYTLFPVLKTPAITRYRVKQVANDYHFDISKAKQMLDYKPKVLFKDGIGETAVAYREWKRNSLLDK